MKITAWRKSTYSTGAQQNCVEVGRAPNAVGIRDTKNPDQGHLAVSRTTWTAFVHHITR